MQVAVLTTSFPRHEHDWAGRVVLDQAKALGERGGDVTVVAPDEPGFPETDTVDGVAVRRVRYAWPRATEGLAYGAGMAENLKARPSLALQLPGLVLALRRGLADMGRDAVPQPDVVLAHWALAGLAAAPVCRRRGVPLITVLNGSDLTLALGDGLLARTWARTVKRALAASAFTVVLSGAMGRDAIAAGLVRDDRVSVVPQGVDDALLSRPVGPGEEGRVLFVGRMVESKGVRELAEAVKLLPPPAHLVCAGDGPLVAELSGLAQVTCLGPLEHFSVLDEMQRAAVVALPSHAEGLPNVLLEAMALGRPVVATPVGGIPELVRGDSASGATGPAGLLVPAGDARSLSQALESVLGHPASARELGERGRVRIAARYARSVCVDRLLELMEEARTEASARARP
jgi:glycosyltransferase involved in cell wall biosynthesis